MKYFVFLLLLSVGANAQEFPDYMVYLVKGNATVKKANANPSMLRQQQFVYKEETIQLGKGAELTLSDKDGKLFVLNVPNSYPVSTLGKRQTKATDNLTQKYLHLLYHELLDPNHDFNKFKKQNIGGVWGGVSRGGECGNLIFPIQDMKTADLHILFKWRKTSAVSKYQLKIYNAQAKELVSLPVNDTALLVDLSGYNVTPGKYYWRIEGEQSSCEDERPLSFEIITPAEEEQKLALLQKNEESIFNKLWVVGQLEKEHFVPQAQKYFASLVQNSNDASLVQTYTWFLLKYHLEKEAEMAWQQLSQQP